jgi:hypothetical protein
MPEYKIFLESAPDIEIKGDIACFKFGNGVADCYCTPATLSAAMEAARRALAVWRRTSGEPIPIRSRVD